MNDLIGQRIHKVYRNADSTKLAFRTYAGQTVAYIAFAPCCSRSWFEHVAGTEALFGATVAAVDERETVTEPYAFDGDDVKLLQVYGYGVTTNAGVAVIELRNELNGSYEGSMELVVRHDDCTIEITGDF